MENKAPAVLVRPITVLVVDDHPLVRSAISHALSSQPEIKLVVTVQNYTEAEEQASQLLPDIIWLDMHITHGDSIAEIRFLNKLSPSSRIIVLADREDEQEAFAAIMMGAQGYRSKQDVDPEEMMAMIHALCRGELVLRPVLLMCLVGRLRSAAMPLWGSESGLGYRALQPSASLNGLAQLTAREREILQLISQGHRDRDIAKGLCISEKTVQKHVQSILSKLGAQNRTEAAYLIRQRAG
ncbi:MAG: response regulator transcription factor [Ktedonobacteraceae bacterium]|nr:response regulator transcription factor [Ktedonobacteraceae bacterium]